MFINNPVQLPKITCCIIIKFMLNCKSSQKLTGKNAAGIKNNREKNKFPVALYS